MNGLDVVAGFEVVTRQQGASGEPIIRREVYDLAFVANGWAGLEVFDVTNPRSVRHVGNFQVADPNDDPATNPKYVLQVKVDRENKLAYLSLDDQLVVLDVSNPMQDLGVVETAPLITNSYPPAGTPGGPEGFNRPVLIEPELGLAFSHGTNEGVNILRVDVPTCRFVLEQGGSFTPLGEVVPLGVPVPEGWPATDSVRLALRLPGGIVPGTGAALQVSLQALNAYGHPVRDVDYDGVVPSGEPYLWRASDNKAEEEYNLFLSDAITFTADPEQEHLLNDTFLTGDLLSCTLLMGNQNYLERSELPLTEGRVVSTRSEWLPSDQPEPPRHPSLGTGDAFGVLLHSGEAVLVETDLAVAGRELDFALTRVHRSQAVWAGPFGSNWDSPLNERLRILPDGNVEHYPGTGRVELYTLSGNACGFSPPLGRFGCLQPHQDGFRLLHRDGTASIFDRHGTLLRLVGRHTRNRIVLQRDPEGRLVAVTDTMRRRITFDYDAHDRIETVKDWDGRELSYSYGEGDQHWDALTKATFMEMRDNQPEPLDTRYTYVNLPRAENAPPFAWGLDTLTTPEGEAALDNGYTGHQVTTQDWGEDELSISIEGLVTTVTDRRQAATLYTHNADGQVVTVEEPGITVIVPGEPNDSQTITTEFAYGEGLLTRVFHPRGRETWLDYNARGDLRELKSVAGERELIWEYDRHEPTGRVTRVEDPEEHVWTAERNAQGDLEILTPPSQGDSTGSFWEYDYNEYGQLTEIRPPVGNEIVHEYHPEESPGGQWTNPDPTELNTDTGGYLHTVERSTGEGDSPAGPSIKTATRRDSRGNPTLITDPLGTQHSVSYNNRDLPLDVVRDVGGFGYGTDFDYDKDGNLVMRSRDYQPGGGSIVETWDGHDALGTFATRTIQGPGLPTGGLTTNFAHDANRNLELVTLPGERQIYFRHDERDRLTQVTRGYGSDDASTQTFVYDKHDNLERFYTGLGTEGPEHFFTEMLYDGLDRLTHQVDPEGAASAYCYDDDGRITRVTQFDKGTGTTAAANCEGSATSISDGMLARTLYKYDVHKCRDKVSHILIEEPSGSAHAGSASCSPDPCPPNGLAGRALTTDYSCDVDGRVSSVTDPELHTTSYGYDGARRLIGITGPPSPGGALDIDLALDPAGLVRGRTEADGAGRTLTYAMDYDALGRLSTHTDPGGHPTRFDHDSEDNVIATTDAKDRTVQRTWDALGRLLSLSEPFDRARLLDPRSLAPDIVHETTQWSYDPQGRYSTMTDARGNTTRWEYNLRGLTEGIIYPEDMTETMTWTRDDAVATRTSLDGTLIEHHYDKRNLLESVDVTRPGEPEMEDMELYDWDGLGRQLQAENPNVTVEFAYDSLSRLLAETGPGGTAVTFEHDGDGLRNSTTYPSGLQLALGHDDLHRLETLQEGGTLVFRELYEGPARFAGREFANSLDLEVDYQQAERLPTDLRLLDSGSNALLELDQAWDATHNRTELTYGHAGGMQDQFGLNVRDEIYKATFGSQAGGGFDREQYLALDQTLNTRLFADVIEDQQASRANNTTVNQRNQYTQLDATTLEYDGNGNLKRDHQGVEYDYDFRNRLTQVDLPDGSQVSFTYDALGRRTTKTYTPTTGPQQTTHYRHDGLHVIEETDDAGEALARYVYASGIDQPVRMERRPDAASDFTSYYFHQNSIGDVLGLTDADGHVREQYRYGLFGDHHVLLEPTLDQLRSIGANELRIRFSDAVTDSALDASVVWIDVPPGNSEASRELLHQGQELKILLEGDLSPGDNIQANLAEGLVSRQGMSRYALSATPIEFQSDAVLRDESAPLVDRAIQAPDPDLLVSFTEPIDEATTTGAITLTDSSNAPLTFTTTLEPEDNLLRITPDPNEMVPGQTYTLTLATTIRDLDGKGLEGPTEWQFDAANEAELVYLRSQDAPQARASALDNPIRFQGREYDPETGLYYFRARYLHPRLGRWLQQDPLGYEDGPNLYAAFGGNPVSATDPLGLASRRTQVEEMIKLILGNGGKVGKRTVTHLPRFAGKRVTTDLLRKYTEIPEEVLKKIDERFPGLEVPYNDAGLPDFAKATHRGTDPLILDTVRLGYFEQGKYGNKKDITKAWKEFREIHEGLSPEEFFRVYKENTPHHDIAEGDMLILDSDVHNAFRHLGGAALNRAKLYDLLQRAGEVTGMTVLLLTIPSTVEAGQSDELSVLDGLTKDALFTIYEPLDNAYTVAVLVDMSADYLAPKLLGVRDSRGVALRDVLTYDGIRWVVGAP